MKQSRTLRFDTEKEDDMKALNILKSLKDGIGNQFIINAIINYDRQVNGLNLEDIRLVIREELQATELPIKGGNLSKVMPEPEPAKEIKKNEETSFKVETNIENKESLNKAISFIGTL